MNTTDRCGQRADDEQHEAGVDLDGRARTRILGGFFACRGRAARTAATVPMPNSPAVVTSWYQTWPTSETNTELTCWS